MGDQDLLSAAALKFPVGRNVHYYPVPTSSDFVKSRITSKPWVRLGGDVVVAIEGLQHPVAVDCLERSLMVAYSFKARFEMPIREGWKTQTIRGGRARHAHPGEMLQLFVGMRTAHCRKICPDVRCTDVLKVVISFDGDGAIERIITDGVPVRDLDAFAVHDGFKDAVEMAEFWRREHTPVGLWHGVIIEWAAPRAAEEDMPA